MSDMVELCFKYKLKRCAVCNSAELAALKLKDKDEQIKILKEALIFYSDLEKYEEDFAQLDWALVNNPAAIQDKGRTAREALKKIEEMENEG